ncbi:MAG: glutaredoxin-like protein NrdH [Actinomycetaceae bacterium]|nr:glutaredoxin-like protein NrdH [Actinomycetaceae bacterium]
MTITVYSKPMCVQCDATKRALNKQGLDYATIDISEDAAALDYVKSLGYAQAPVVIAGDQHWSGYRPDLIKKVAKSVALVVNG